MIDDDIDFCNKEWDICPNSIDLPNEFEGEPHICFHAKGHHQDHECGTCDAVLELSEDERSSLEEPRR